MQINNILDAVFSAQSNIVILRAMINYNTGISGREVSRISGLSPRACFNTLTSLENIGVVKRVRGGRDHLFAINRDSYIVSEAILPLLNAESAFLESIKKDIKSKLKNKCSSVYIYGSVVRKDESGESDFDICVVMNNQKEQALLEIEISELTHLAYLKYGITLSPVYFTVNEFVKRYNLNKPPIPDIVNEGIVIYGNKQINNGKKT
jgi:predicted nucleotidyltransferase